MLYQLGCTTGYNTCAIKSTHAAVLSMLNECNFRGSNVWQHCNVTTTSSHAALPSATSSHAALPFTSNLLAYAVQTLHMVTDYSHRTPLRSPSILLKCDYSMACTLPLLQPSIGSQQPMLHRHVDMANPLPAGLLAVGQTRRGLSLPTDCGYLCPLLTVYPRYLSRSVRSGLTALTPTAALEASPWLATAGCAELRPGAAMPFAAGGTSWNAVLAAGAGRGSGAEAAAAGGGDALAWGGGPAARRHRSALADRGPRPAVRDASSASSRLPSLVTACIDARKDLGDSRAEPSQPAASQPPQAA